MYRVALDELSSDVGVAGVERRRLTAPLDADGLAVTHYRVAPDTGLPAGLHAHADQEEVFVVLAGTAAFDVLVPPSEGDGRVTEASAHTRTVAAGEAVRFAPGEFQSGRNAGAEPLAVLALGAPRDSTDLRLPVGCPDCGRLGMALRTDGDGDEGGDAPRFECPSCGATRVPTPCPDCGGEDLQVRLRDGARESTRATRGRTTVVACVDCGAAFDTPPVDGRW